MTATASRHREFAERLDRIKPSASIAAAVEVAKLRQAGIPILSLTIGEPDFDPPRAAVDAMVAAAQRRDTAYRLENPPLVQAIIARFERDCGLTFDEREIVVGAGLKQVIFAAFCATIDEGDEVVVPAPYWVSYPDIAQLFGGKVVTVECAPQHGFKMTPAQLESALTPRTRWVVLNSPNNPTGAIYSAEEMAALGAVIAEHPDCLVLSDEIYQHFTYGGATFASFLGANPALRDRVVTANGVSKAYALAGLRIGYAAGPPALIAKIRLVISQDTSCAASISQAAATAALSGDQSDLSRNRATYQQRRDRLLRGLAPIPGLDAIPPDGAFYAFVSVRGLIGATTDEGEILESDADIAAYFVRTARVAMVAGGSYGSSPYLRASFATSDQVIDDACKALAEAVSRLTPADRPTAARPGRKR